MSGKREVQAQPTIIDGDWESNGMYRWYIGPPAKLPKRSKADDQQHVAELKTYLNQPWPERLAEWREWLTEMIAPWWEGPLDDDIFWQSQKRGSHGWGEQLVKDGPWRWRRKHEDVGEVVIANASTGNGYYRMVEGAPTGGYIRDAISALCSIDSLEKKINKATDLNSIVRLAIEVGQDIEQVRHQALFAPVVLIGKHRIVDHPKAMRKAKARKGKQKQLTNLQRAKQAIQDARYKYPTAAEDNSESFLKSKAAENLEIDRSTLYRWLRPKKK